MACLRATGIVVILVALLCAGGVPTARPAAAGAPGPGAWAAPVDGPIVEHFDPPLVRWGAGHLGVDYRVVPGSAVTAAGSGTVAFAGQVAGSLHVVVVHPGGLRTSYSFLSAVEVRRGQTVSRGDAVGRSGGEGSGHGTGVLHFGLRLGESYVDPLVLFSPVDLVAAVRLVPSGATAVAASPGVESDGLLAGLGRLLADAGDATVSAVAALLGGGADAAAGLLSMVDTLDVAFRPLAGALSAGAIELPWVVDWLSELEPIGLLPGLALDVGGSLLRWARTLDECDPDAPPADGSGGSGNGVMIVAGLNSSAGSDGATTDLPVQLLGYAPDEVEYYSYAEGGGPHQPDDSHMGIEAAAVLLAAQLREMQTEQPGREVDLIAHSQGGVVAVAFLTLIYDPADPSYPPLGPVVTLSSPHRGAPLATAEVLVAATPAGRALLEWMPDDLVPRPRPNRSAISPRAPRSSAGSMRAGSPRGSR
ncbi:MAG: peptidoglycan DD-metalloendopeptidase family protein [Acidimicrobiia bacterium]|nr:peptidoglycan DD-metalloendopeptidase family protein [Acidimicrobiia bacterium]